MLCERNEPNNRFSKVINSEKGKNIDCNTLMCTKDFFAALSHIYFMVCDSTVKQVGAPLLYSCCQNKSIRDPFYSLLTHFSCMKISIENLDPNTFDPDANLLWLLYVKWLNS